MDSKSGLRDQIQRIWIYLHGSGAILVLHRTIIKLFDSQIGTIMKGTSTLHTPAGSAIHTFSETVPFNLCLVDRDLNRAGLRSRRIFSVSESASYLKILTQTPAPDPLRLRLDKRYPILKEWYSLFCSFPFHCILNVKQRYLECTFMGVSRDSYGSCRPIAMIWWHVECCWNEETKNLLEKDRSGLANVAYRYMYVHIFHQMELCR